MKVKRWRVLALSFIMVGQVGCITLAQPTIGDLVNVVTTMAPALIPISEKEEIAIGRDIAANVAGRYGVVEDYGLTRYVNLVGNTVARKSDRPNLNYHFAVLDTDIVNAFACPGGYIFVTRGTLDIIDSESELAAVLAHEVAHVAKKHIVKEIEKTKFLSAGTRVAGDLLNADSNTFEAVTSFGTDILFKGLSRSDEYQADRFSLIYSSSAGYEPTSLVTFLEKLKSEGSGSNSGGVALLFSTHPKVDDRLYRASAAMSELGLSGRPGASLTDRYNANVHLIKY